MFSREVRRRIKGNRGPTAGDLIAELNPLVRGWLNYHRHVVSKATFHAVDHAIMGAVWAWAVRRHRNKPKRWIKDKHFHVRGARRWVFTGTARGSSGYRKVVRLFAADRVPVGRHRLIRARANSYNPDWKPYFEARWAHARTRSLAGNWQLLRHEKAHKKRDNEIAMDYHKRMKECYDRLAPEYEGNQASREEALEDIPGLLHAISLLPPVRTLDVECGTGFLTQHLGTEMTGLGQSEAMLEIARKRVPRAEFVRADAFQMPFAERSFERMFASFRARTKGAFSPRPGG